MTKTHDQYRHVPVEDLADDQLLFDQTQIKISIECGVSPAYHKELAARQAALYKEMAHRAGLRQRTAERVEQASLKASKLETLWALICAAQDDRRAVDPMATDERFRAALDCARTYTADYANHPDITFRQLHALSEALVDMESDLAQARGFLVSMTRAAEKWRSIARGEKA